MFDFLLSPIKDENPKLTKEITRVNARKKNKRKGKKQKINK